MRQLSKAIARSIWSAVAVAILGVYFLATAHVGPNPLPAASDVSRAVPTVPPPSRVAATTLAATTAEVNPSSIVRDAATPTPKAVGPIPAKGRVISSHNGRPLVAWISIEDGSRWSTNDDGSFDIVVNGKALVFTSKGFKEQTVDLGSRAEAVDLGEIRLEPRFDVQVVVRDSSGRGIVADVIDVIPSRGLDPSHEHVLGQTDGAGVLGVSLSERTFLYARTSKSASAAAEWNPGEENLTLVLPSESTTVIWKARDAGTPARVSFRFEYLRAAVRLVLVREQTADVPLSPMLPLGGYDLCAASTLNSIVDCVPGRRTRNGPEDDWHVDVREESASIRVSIDHPKALSLHILDAETQAPVPRAAAWVEVDTDNSWKLGGGMAQIENTDDGWLTPSFLKADNLQENPGRRRLVVWSPGYTPESVFDTGTTLTPDVLEIRLRRATEQGTLKIVDSTGRPYPYFLHVTVSSLFIPIWSGTVPPDGVIQRVPLPEGETIEVRTAAHNNCFKVQTSTDRVRQAAPDAFVLTIPTGAIHATMEGGVDIAVGCMSVDGGTYTGRYERNGWIFASLPPGSYTVGPRAVLDTLPMRMANGVPVDTVQVQPGKVAEVHLADVSAPPDVIHGRVLAVGVEPDTLFVAPLYGDPTAPVSGGRGHDRFAVTRDGSYELRDLALEPSRVLVGYLDNDGLEVPLAIAPSGETVRVECGMVELTIDIVRARHEFTAIWSAGVQGGRAVSIFHTEGTVGAPLQIGPMPVGTRVIQVIGENLHDLIPIALLPGKTVSVRKKYE